MKFRLDVMQVIDTLTRRKESFEACMKANQISGCCCPCGAYPTLEESGNYEICVMCD